MSELAEIRDKLAAEKMGLQQNIAGLGISKNYAYRMRGTSDNPVWETRKTWVERIIQIDKELRDVNNALKGSNRSSEDKMKTLKHVIKEVFGLDAMCEIGNEADRRIRGEAPMKVSCITPPSKVKSYKKEYLDAVEMLIKARNAINTYIFENEPEINKAVYLQEVSALNKCLPSYSEIEKLKYKI